MPYIGKNVLQYSNYFVSMINHPPGQNGRNFTDDVSKCIFMSEKFCILIPFSLMLVTKGPIHNKSALVLVTTWQQICPIMHIDKEPCGIHAENPNSVLFIYSFCYSHAMYLPIFITCWLHSLSNVTLKDIKHKATKHTKTRNARYILGKKLRHPCISYGLIMHNTFRLCG